MRRLGAWSPLHGGVDSDPRDRTLRGRVEEQPRVERGFEPQSIRRDAWKAERP